MPSPSKFILPDGKANPITSAPYRFLGKLPLRKGVLWHRAIVAAAFLIWVAMGEACSSRGDSYAPSTSSYNHVASMDTSAVPSATADNGGSSSSADLLTRIDRYRAGISELDTQLKSERADLEAIAARIRVLDSELTLMKEHSDAYTPAAVEDYNDKVKKYNTLLGTQSVLFAAFKAKVERNEEMVNQVNRLIEQYNGRNANR